MVPAAARPRVAPSRASLEGAGRPGLALLIVSLAQLMIALDATVMNIALPSAQRALAMTDADRQWPVTAYALAFGGLVLLGGRLADLAGRRRAFLAGLLGFAAASAVGGAATTGTVLVGARAVQGAFAALLAPTALSLLAVSFPDARERARAFAVYAAIAGSGAAVGLLVGGLLVQYLGWRWCLYVNVPIALLAAAGARLALPAHPAAARADLRLDLVGTALVGGGLVALVYASSQGVISGWASPPVVLSLATSAALLVAFVVLQSRLRRPLLPLRLLRSRRRTGAYLCVALAVAGMAGTYLSLTYYLQVALHFSPVLAGLAFLPLSAGVLLSSQLLAARLLRSLPPRALICGGLATGAAATAILSRLGGGAGYAEVALPAEILLGIGMGCVFVPAFALATRGVAAQESGVASAVVNVAQQVGASVGTALLNSAAAAASAAFLATRAAGSASAAEALVQGFSVAAVWAAAILVAAAFLALVLIADPDSPRPSFAGPGRPQST